MPGRKRPVTADLIRSIITRVMEQYDLDPADIPEEHPFVKSMIADSSRFNLSKRYFLKKALAGFVCSGLQEDGVTICPRQWSSYQASAVIDLRDKTVAWVGRQRCKMCYDNHTADEWKDPHFGPNAIERMARLAVESCLVRLERRPRERRNSWGRHRPGRVHEKQHCELCSLSRESCCNKY